jgi:hypothetical protein
VAATIEIDWGSAQVRDGRLTVALSDKAPEALAGVIERLGREGHPWGDVEVGKKKLQVAGVSPGDEAQLRHFLESAVLQANADAGLTADEEDEDAGEHVDSADAEMTAAFRAFADD